VPVALVEKVCARVREQEHYLLVDPWSKKTLQVDVASGAANLAEEAMGCRASSLDGTEIFIMATAHFSVSRLAPYTGWESFYSRASRDWGVWKRIVGYQRIQRIGVRYINRIDIPSEPGQKIALEDYFTCYPETPEMTGFPGLSSYAMQLQLAGGPDGCALTINGGAVPSPLLHHASFLLDLDVYKEGDVPQKDEELWGMIARIRGYKNQAFESCITDQARALFY
jgi:uncharacterized protein (TIGR04255 family)